MALTLLSHLVSFTDFKVKFGRFCFKMSHLLSLIHIWKDRRYWEPGLYIPSNIYLEIVRHFHSDPEASHPGAEEMFRAIAKDFVWILPGVIRDIANQLPQA